MSTSILSFFRRSDFAAVLARRNYRFLLAADIASSVGTAVLFIDILLHLLRMQEPLLSTISAITTSYAAPMLILRPLAGLLSDRMDRKLLMLLAHVALVFILALLFMAGQLGELNVYFLAVGAFLLNSARQFYLAARGALLPQLLARNKLVAGNAAMGVVHQPILLTGGAMAGFLIATVGGLNAPGIVLLIYGLAAFLVSCIEAPQQVGYRSVVVSEVRLHTRLVGMVKEAIVDIWIAMHFMFKEPVMRSVALAWVILDALRGSIVLIAVTKAIGIGLSETAVSVEVQNAIGSGGIILGLLAVPWVARRLGDGRASILALLALGVLFATMAVLGELWWGLPLVVAISVVAATKLHLWSIVQAECPDHLRGRVLANMSAISLMLVVFASIAFVALIDVTSLGTSLLAAGAVTIILSLALLKVNGVRQVRLSVN
jgi:MFS family permease